MGSVSVVACDAQWTIRMPCFHMSATVDVRSWNAQLVMAQQVTGRADAEGAKGYVRHDPSLLLDILRRVSKLVANFFTRAANEVHRILYKLAKSSAC